MLEKAFKDNVVIISGASSGIGKELAFLLASEGAWLSLAARNERRLEEVAAKCRELGGKALVVATDVSHEEQCRRLIESTAAEYGRIDTLVNNAGYGLSARLDELPDLDEFRRLMDVNLLGSIYCTFYALPHIRRAKGRIVAISSVLGKFGTPRNTAYSASKFGMAGFFDALRLEVKADGVSVTTIFPSLTVTEFAERIKKADGSLTGESGKRIYGPETMTAVTAARIIRDAAALRKREVVLTRAGRFAEWMHRHLPSVFDYLALKITAARKRKLAGRHNE